MRNEHQKALIEMMEGVEDIPGITLTEGLKWDWESFPEYLDALERLPRTIDIGAQVAHHPLRVYAMGERAIKREERLGDGEAAVRAVVERALEPLRGRGVVGVVGERHHEAREARGALAAHRVALVGHGARADLVALEGLVDLAQVAEEPQVGGALVHGARGDGEAREHLCIGDARVGLRGERPHALVGPAEVRREGLLELRDPLGPAAAEREVGGLRAGGAAQSAQAEPLDARLDFRQRDREVLRPLRRSPADRDRLCGLVVREPERRLGLPALRERGEAVYDAREPLRSEGERLALQERVGVADDILACGAEVDDRARSRCSVAERVHVRHHVVPQLALMARGGVEVDVFDRGLDRGNLLGRRTEVEAMLAPGKREPDAPPCHEAVVIAPDGAHGARRVARLERRSVAARWVVVRRGHCAEEAICRCGAASPRSASRCGSRCLQAAGRCWRGASRPRAR